jgi:ATP-dependent DNA ligase
MPYKPMIFWNKDWTWEDVQYPSFVSAKYDGVFAHKSFIDGKVKTKRDKPIANLEIAALLDKVIVPGMQVEIVRLGKTFYETQSALTTIEGPIPDDLKIVAFDLYRGWKAEPYRERFRHLLIVAACLGMYKQFMVAHQQVCNSKDEIIEFAENLVTGGAEGAMIRAARSHFVFGRSGKDEGVFKYTPMLREEARIIGFTCNSSNVKQEEIGALIVMSDKWGQMEIGSGLTRDLSMDIKFNFNKKYQGREITYKYKPYGTKDSPRQPIFVGFTGN